MINQKSSKIFNKFSSTAKVDKNTTTISNIEGKFSGLKLGSPNAKIKLANFMAVVSYLSTNQQDSSLFATNPSNIITNSRPKLIVALLDLNLGLNQNSAESLIDLCLDDTKFEQGINFNQIYTMLTGNSYIANSVKLFTETQLKNYKAIKFSSEVVNQADMQLDELVNQINIATLQARALFVEKLILHLGKLSSQPSLDVAYLKLLLMIVPDLEFGENDTTDRFIQSKLMSALDNYSAIIRNDIVVRLIKSLVVQEQKNVQTGYVNISDEARNEKNNTDQELSEEASKQNESISSSRYSNQFEVADSNNFSYSNTDASNQAHSTAPIATSPQLPANLIISIKDQQTGNVESSYQVCETLTLDEAQAVEKQSGVILKAHSYHPDKFNGFLGGGAFGRVYVAKQKDSNPTRYAAIKIVQGNQKALVESKHESGLQLKLTKAVNSEDSQLMPILGIGENLNRSANESEKLYIVMPLAGMGSGEGLRSDLSELKKSNNAPEFFRLLNLHIAKSMLIGLHQMHRNNIYHLDLKPANMMVTGDGKIQLADFGTSEEVAGTPPSLKVGKDQESGRFIGNGDSTYFPHERTFNQGSIFNPAKADIYAAGAVLFEFLTGNEFNGSDLLKHPIFNNVVKGSLEELTLRLLNPEASSRISLEDALNHPCLSAPHVHDANLMKVVLTFLGGYVRHAQSKARGEITLDQANQALQASLAQSQVKRLETDIEANLLVMNPFKNRPDIHEQLAMYLPLSASTKRKVEDHTQDIVDLHQQTEKFLTDPKQTLLLLLADGGSGKSLYMQYLTTTLGKTNAPNGKPYLPLYIVLSKLTNPAKLFEDGLGLTSDEVKALQEIYELVILADGFDEQTNWGNLYTQNQLEQYDTANGIIKLLITCRINALPPSYSEYFDPKVIGENSSRGMQQLYIQPFKADQIDTYVTNYIKRQEASIRGQIDQKQLPLQWLDPKYVQNQIKQISGLKELMQTPLLSQLILIALPQLSQTRQAKGIITRAQVYAAFMRQWIITQMITKQHKSLSQITQTEINQVLAFGQMIALNMYRDNKSAQLDVGLTTFSFSSSIGKYQQNQSKYPWLEHNKPNQALLPLQEAQTGIYKFVHLSMQEYLLASCLADELTQSNTLKDLLLNQLPLSIDEKDCPILYFLGDMASKSSQFADKLFALIYQTREDETQSIAGANAITILNVSNVLLIHRDFSNTRLPNSNLSGGILFNTNFSKADLSNSNLQGTRLNDSNFKGAKLSQISLGQYPMYRSKEKIEAISYSPDGHYLAISQKNEVIFFDANTRKKVGYLKGHIENITAISFSGDRTKVATGSCDKTCRIWDIVSGKELHLLSGHTERITSVSFSPDGRRVATGSWDSTCRVWDVVSGEELRLLSGHNEGINSVSFSPDGTKVATVSKDKTCRIWDVESCKELQMLCGHTEGVSSVSFSPDGTKVVTGSKDQTCRIWDVESCKELRVLRGHTGDIRSVSFSPDGTKVATGSWDSACRLWDVVNGEGLRLLSGHSDEITSVSFSPDGTKVVTGSLDSTCRVWDVVSGEGLRLLSGHTDMITSVSFSPDGTKVATGSWDSTCLVWDVVSCAELRFLRGHIGVIYSVSFSPDGTKVATGGVDKTCRIWDVENCKELWLLSGHSGRINGVSFSPDGRRIATVSEDKTCRIWDVVSGEELRLLSGHTNEITSVSFSPDGTKVATMSMDQTCRIWDAVSGEELRLLSGHTGGIRSVSFSPDGTKVATGGVDKICQIWDVVSGKNLKVLRGHTDQITSVDFSSDETKLITRTHKGEKKIWVVVDGTELKGDQASLEPQRAYHILDNITASYENKKVTLSQKVIESNNTLAQSESFSINFPNKVKDIHLSKDSLGSHVILTVVMNQGVAFYHKELNAPLSKFVAISVSVIDRSLGASKMDISGSIGLSQSNYTVLEQLGATGKPAKT